MEQDATGLIRITPAEREKLEKYCDFFELSLPYLLGEAQPQIARAKQILRGLNIDSSIKAERGIHNCKKNIQFFKIDKQAWLQVLSKSGRVVAIKPETLQHNISILALSFESDGWNFPMIQESFLKDPKLLTQSPYTIISNVDDLVHFAPAVFALSRSRWIKACIRTPRILGVNSKESLKKLADLHVAEQEGYIRYPKNVDGTCGDLIDFIHKYGVTLTVSNIVFNKGLDLARRKYCLTGRPSLSITRSIAEQARLEQTLANFQSSVPKPFRSKPKITIKPKPVWQLLIDDQNHAALLRNGRTGLLHEPAMVLLLALRAGPVGAALPKSEEISSMSTMVVQMAAANLRSVAAKLDPKQPLIEGSYANGGLRLSDPAAFGIVQRKAPRPAL